MSRYFMFGKHPSLAALKNSNRTIYKIYCNQKFFAEFSKLFLKRQFEIVDNHYLSKLTSNVSHQGVVLDVESVFQKFCSKFLKTDPLEQMILVLDQIQDSQNLGAIIRTAVAFKSSYIILTNRNSPSENSFIAKSASGALEHIKIFVATNLNHVFPILKKSGFWIVALTSYGQSMLSDVPQLSKIALVIGSEARGIRRLVNQKCDFHVQIPISPSVDSLNASNATAVALYHFSQFLSL